MGGARRWLGVGAALLIAQDACATLNRYDHETLMSNFLIYRKNALYSLGDEPARNGADAEAVVDVNLDFSFPEDVRDDEDAIVQVSVFPLEDYQYIGVAVPAADGGTERVFCCTEEMSKSGKVCSTPGKLIIDSRATNTETYDVRPEEQGDSHLKRKYEVRQTGLHYLVISYCNSQPSSVTINGVTRWINPFGYLPGEVYGFLPFYSYISMSYLLCALTWAYLCARQWRELLQLQNWCTVVIAFGLLEVYLRYMDYYHFNEYGERSKGLMLSYIFFLCLKKTLSRVLVLVVSLGFGVIKPTLGEASGRIMLIGAAYFFFSCVQLTVENLSHSHSLTVSGYLLVLPVVCIDFLFFIWIFSSLSSIIAALSERHQDTKLALYKNFRSVLIVCVAAGVAWSIIFSYCVMSNWAETHWESFYMLEAFWDVLYFAVLVLVLYLWRPTSNSKRYAYDRVSTSELDAEGYEDDLEDMVAANDWKGGSNK